MISAITATFRAASCRVDLARELPNVFRHAGLEPATVTGEFLIGGRDDRILAWATHTHRSIVPVAVRTGVVAAEADPDELIARVRAEAAEGIHACWSPPFVGVAARSPRP